MRRPSIQAVPPRDGHFGRKAARALLANRTQRAATQVAFRIPAALSIWYDTDKGEGGYIPYYRRFFGPLRSRAATLLEIGIHKGASLQMWRHYLPKATIVGVDLKLPDLPLPGIAMHAGDQSDETFLASLVSRYGGFDIVIDDGSHIGRHINASFGVLFPAIRPGGWYVIEDLGTAYWESHEGGPVGTPGTGVDLVKSLVDRTNRHSGMRDIAELHVYSSIAFIRKAPVPRPRWSPSIRRIVAPAGRRLIRAVRARRQRLGS